ncbi:hypothetical protein [Ensifer sp. Root127]|uniref:hypothetical protein n=1 Tax=Ensifer sp. Root127 TaxID=1736440 RepID=UPI0007094939|nr:hypothetical protein [Ensifer sp. Root127]KQW72455.1 hypothetical protein ASD03_32425 [Ensifer sp. Root127]
MKHTLLNLDGTISRIQLAFRGEWETSLHVTPGSPDIVGVMKWLLSGGSDLAIEAFYETPRGEAFVGVRISGLRKTHQHEIAQELVDAFSKREIIDVGTFVRRVSALLAAPLFTSDASFLELGKVNAWRSFGPITFWSEETGGAPLAQFDEALAVNPRFRQASTLPYAIELGFDGVFPHWVGLPVSENNAAGHVISRQWASDIFASA